jgi:TonB family protein
VKPVASALLAALACAGPLAAQQAPRERRLLPVLSTESIVLSLDSAAVHRTGDSTFLVTSVYQFPADTALAGADRREDVQEMDCVNARLRYRTTRYYASTAAEPVRPAHGTGSPTWAAPAGDELPLFHAICDYLTSGWPARLPKMVEEQPRIVNAPAVQRALTREYPSELRQMGLTGQVMLRFRVRTDGTVEPASMEVVSATDTRFGEAARRVALTMRFRPARLDRQPVAVWVTLPVNFNLSTPLPTTPGVPPMP